MDDRLLDYFSGVKSIKDFEKILRSANGQFSVIIENPDEIWAATDRLRNFPLFYRLDESLYKISDNCYKLTDSNSENQFNLSALDSYLASGYVINNLTLINNIFQVEAGEYVVLGRSYTHKFFYDLKNGGITVKDFDTSVIELQGIVIDVFKGHFKALSDKFLAVSLSGGYDSRLVAAMCSQYHPENVICYTYGTSNNPETVNAREISGRLGIKWYNIEYNSQLIQGFLEDDTFLKYYTYASDLSSMFFMQDYFAVKFLKENKIVPDDCVFITGFSGDMLAGSHLTPAMKNHMEKSHIADVIYNEYFGLVELGRDRKSEIIELIKDKISDNNYESWQIFETWDQKERQAKFIVNSAKVFTFFGYNYVLPLWDNLLVDFFSILPFQFKLNKKLYDHVLKEHIFKDLNLNLPDETTPSPAKKSFQRIKEKIKKHIPYKLKNIFIRKISPVLYDEITKLMIEDIGANRVIQPRQSNYYNSYIIQWYLKKTSDLLKININ